MFSRVVGEDRIARTVLVLAGKRSDSFNVNAKLTNTPIRKELYIRLQVHKDSITDVRDQCEDQTLLLLSTLASKENRAKIVGEEEALESYACSSYPRLAFRGARLPQSPRGANNWSALH